MSDFFSKILAVFPKEIRDNWILIVLLIIGGMYLFNYFKMNMVMPRVMSVMEEEDIELVIA